MRASLRLGALLVLVACGSKQPPSAPFVGQPPVPAPPAADCRDVGVILRGELDGDDPDAGPAKERAIEDACREDRWSQAVIHCIASTPPSRTQACLDRLEPKQHVSWNARIEKFREAHPGDGGAYNALADAVPCPQAAADPSVFPPALAAGADERAWTEDVRRGLLLEECEHGWSDALKQCLRDAVGNAATTDACLVKELAPDERDELVRQLTDLDRLATKVAGAKLSPATLGCKQVVAQHYGDARWKTKLDGYPAAERKKLIAASRAKMTKACNEQHWADTLRACIVVGGDETCFRSYGMALEWGYPAAGVIRTLGIKECDEYGAAVMKLAACAKIPQDSRDALVRSFEQTQAHVAGLPAGERARLAPTCKAGLDAITEVAQSAGC